MPEPTLVEAVTGLQNDLTALHRQIDAACLEIRHLRRVNGWLLASMKDARSELEIVFHKFERAGGIWKVADRGVPLGASSWASNVENGLNNTRAVLDGAIQKAEGD